MALFISIILTCVLELRWSGVSIQDWWRNEQFWVIGGVSAHFFAVFQGLLKVGGVHTNFTVRAKSANDTAAFGQLYLFKWTTLLIPPTSLVILNMVGIVAGISDAINNGYDSWGPFFGKLFFSLWVILHLYPFLKGLMGRQNRTPYHCSPLVNSSSHNFLNDLGANWYFLAQADRSSTQTVWDKMLRWCNGDEYGYLSSHFNWTRCERVSI